jgi:hypothetical protein
VLQNYLKRLYTTFGTGGSYGGVKPLYNKVLEDKKYDISKNEIKEFLKNTDTYTLHAPARRSHKTQRTIIGGWGNCTNLT